MRKNLKRVLDEKGISMSQYGLLLGVDMKTGQNKVNGVSEVTLKEALKTRLLFPEYAMEYLFREDYDEVGTPMAG